MTEPRRLLEDGGDFERSLVGAWQDQKPSPRARAELFALAGLAATAATAATAASAATGVAAAGGSIAPKAAGLGGVALAKWLAVGVAGMLALAATGGVVLVSARDHAAPLVAPPSAPASTAEKAAAIATPTAQASPDPSPPAWIAPTTAVAAPAPTVATSPAAPHAAAKAHDTPAGSSLADQVAAMDRARAALEEGDAARALRLVDEYEARFHGGAFQQEADVLRVEALVRRGDRAGAQRAGARFLAAHPQSPHAGHVRALVESQGGAAP